MDQLHYKSATELASLIRRKKVSALELLDHFLARIETHNAKLNAIVWMDRDKVYKVTLTPMNTSSYFDAGHRIRIEIAGANFPRFDRNLNTGGNNYDETTGIVAHTAIHHSAQYPSTLTISAVKH